ncbi:hypothetical protein MCEMSEM23_01981 [Rhabdaerophilaceae bacterium]
MTPSISTVLIVSGAVVVFAAFAYGCSVAGLPYQDPTHQQQRQWLYHWRMADLAMLTGAVALSIGCMWKAVLWIVRALKTSRSD